MGHIYQIRNIKNNAVYIGSVLKRNPIDRWIRHRKDLRGNIHHSLHLQRAWNKYGESSFIFEVLEKVKSDVIKREQFYIDLNISNKMILYNVNLIAGNCEGRKFSKKSLHKMSISHIGIKRTDESKLKQIKSWENKCKVSYSFTSPDGVIYNNVKNLRKFSREHNISVNGRVLSQLHNGKIRYINGWTKTGVKMPLYELKSPDGVISTHAFLKKLCITANLNYKSVHKQCIKNGKPYKGWFARCIA